MRDVLPDYWHEEVPYVFGFYGHLLSDNENKAWRKIIISEKVEAAKSERMKRMMEERWLNNEAEVIELLKNGKEEFFRKVMEKVYSEKLEEINLCPKCNAICRTPRACLCPRCNHSWYEQRNQI